MTDALNCRRIRLVANGPSAYDAHVESIDGEALDGTLVESVTVEVKAGDQNRVTIVLLPDELEVDVVGQMTEGNHPKPPPAESG